MSDDKEEPNPRQWLDNLTDYQKQGIVKMYMRAIEHAQEADTEAKIERAFTSAYNRAIELGMEEEQPPLKTLEQYRHEKGMSVIAFCQWISIAPLSYYKARRGEKVAPWTIKKIARRLKVKPSEIAEFTRPKE